MRTTRPYTLLAATLLIGVAIACTETATPPAPTALTEEFGPDGSTLKVPPPGLQSPANGTQLTGTTPGVALVAANVSGANGTFPVTLEFEVKNAAGTILANARVPQSTGATTTYNYSAALEANAQYTWRVRGTYNGANGPWSSTSSFRAAAIPPPYIRDNEIFDPLTDGRTVGTVVGAVDWLSGVGVRLTSQNSHIAYTLPTNLQAGTFSMMVTGVDESNPGDKAKIMAMQEGSADLTTNDYRVTAELRGRIYPTPGAVQARIITGNADDHGRIFDTPRVVSDFSTQAWYLWRITWQTGSFTLEARRDGPNGAVIYSSTIGTGSSPYRPVPHVIYVGAPVGRAGPNDATAAGMIVRNVWVSPTQTRPNFPVN